MAHRFASIPTASTVNGEKAEANAAAALSDEKVKAMMEAAVPPRILDEGFMAKIYITEVRGKTFMQDGTPLSQQVTGCLVGVDSIVQPAAKVVLEEVVVNEKGVNVAQLVDGAEKIAAALVDHEKGTITPQCYIRKSGTKFDTIRHPIAFTPEQQAENTLTVGKSFGFSVPWKEWEKIKPMPGMIIVAANMVNECATNVEFATPPGGFKFYLKASGTRMPNNGSPRLEDIATVAFPLAEQRVPPVLELLQKYAPGSVPTYSPGDPNALPSILIPCCNVRPTASDARFACQTILPRGVEEKGIIAEVREFPDTYKTGSSPDTVSATYRSINLLQIVDNEATGGKVKELYTISTLTAHPEHMLAFGPSTPALLDAYLKQHQVPFYLLYEPDLELMSRMPTNGDCETRRTLYMHGALNCKGYAHFRIIPRVAEYAETHGIPVTRALVEARFSRKYKVDEAFPALAGIEEKLRTDKNGKQRYVDRPYANAKNPTETVFIDECGDVPEGDQWRFYALNIDDYKTQPKRRPHEDPETVQRIDMTPEEGTAFLLSELGGITEEKASNLAVWQRADRLPRYVFWAVRALTERECALRIPATRPDKKRKAETAPEEEPESKQARVEAGSPAAPEFASEEEHEQGEEKMDE